jgi:hypothetical protein
MEVLLQRIKQLNNCTIGRIYINGNLFCNTLEDPIRKIKPDGSGKIKGRTAIPEGKFLVILSYSERFRKVLPLLLNVPFFQGIRIHSGNTCDDTEGCILVGKYDGNGYIMDSRKTLSALIETFHKASKAESIYLLVSNECLVNCG